MDRKENLSLKRDFPKIPPHKGVREYRLSVKVTEDFCPSYEWDKPLNHPNQELIEAQRDLDNVEQQLNKKRENLKKIHEKLNEQWDELQENEEKLKENFIKFNKFIRNNEEKRQRARNRLEYSKEQLQQRGRHIDELRQKYEFLQNTKKQMDQQIEENRIYETYLYQVIPLMPGIQNFHQLINRYESLLEARQNLVIRQENNLKELEDIKINVLRIIEENNTKIVGIATQISHSHSRFLYARQQTLLWEKIVAKINNEIFNDYRIKDQAKKCIYNLYLLMCKRKSIPSVYKPDEFQQHLVFIKETLQETQHIHEILMEINRKHRGHT